MTRARGGISVEFGLVLTRAHVLPFGSGIPIFSLYARSESQAYQVNMSNDDAEKGVVVESLPADIDESLTAEGHKEKLSSPNMSLRVVGFFCTLV